VYRLLAAWLIVSGLALAGPHRPAAWPLLALLHLVGVGACLAADRRVRWAQTGRAPQPNALLDWAPLLIMPALYAELAVLNSALWGGRYFDDLVIGWEQALFGGQPSRDLANAAPWPALSEALHFSYLSYYALIFVPPLLIWLRRSRAALRDAVFTVMLVFLAHYLFFVYFPVQGPRYLFPAPGGEAIAGYPFRDLAHRVLESGSSRGAAFPSSHVGVGVAASFVAWRHLRPLAPVVALLTVGLALGAVYGGFHYGVDALAGAALGAGLAGVAPRVRDRMERRGAANAPPRRPANA